MMNEKKIEKKKSPIKSTSFLQKKETEEILSAMNKILDLLLENATQLLDHSQQVISEEELSLLQERQQQLVNELTQKDEEFHQKSAHLKAEFTEIRKRINDKLESFKQLNNSFISNIMNAQGVNSIRM